MTPIDGVEIKKLATFPDPRGFFREVIRSHRSLFRRGFRPMEPYQILPGRGEGLAHP